MTDELTDYILDHYGGCARGPGRCRHDKDGCNGTGGWRGRGCPDWRPVGGQLFTSLYEIMKRSFAHEQEPQSQG